MVDAWEMNDRSLSLRSASPGSETEGGDTPGGVSEGTVAYTEPCDGLRNASGVHVVNTGSAPSIVETSSEVDRQWKSVSKGLATKADTLTSNVSGIASSFPDKVRNEDEGEQGGTS